MKFLLIIFLFPLQLFAQDITGVWTGNLYNDTTKQNIHYELAISEFNGKLSGYSHTTFIIDSIQNVGVKSIKIRKKNDEFLVEDEKLIYNNYAEPPAKGVKTFITVLLSRTDTSEILSGSWNTNRTKEYKKLTGSVFLQKKKKIKETLIVAKLDQIGLSEELSFITPEIHPGKMVVTNQNQIVTQKLYAPKELEKNIVNPTLSDTTQTQLETSITLNTETQPEASKENTKKDKSSQNELIAINKEEIKPTIPAKKLEDLRKQSPAITVKKPKIISTTNPVTINTQKETIKKEITDAPPAADIATRKIETIQTVEVKQDSLVFTLYDNGTVDGDTVSILINGKVVWPRVGLLATAKNKTIYLTPEMGDSMFVVMYAENLGSIPPNTGLLVVRDGEKDYEIRFSGDLQKNSAIILKRKKK